MADQTFPTLKKERKTIIMYDLGSFKLVIVFHIKSTGNKMYSGNT